MYRVGMEGECCDKSIVFTISENGLSITGTIREPERMVSPGACNSVKQSQPANEKQGGGLKQGAEGVGMSVWFRGPVPVLMQIGLDLCFGFLGIVNGHAENHVVRCLTDMVTDTNRGQHKRAGKSFLFFPCHKNRCSWPFFCGRSQSVLV